MFEYLFPISNLLLRLQDPNLVSKHVRAPARLYRGPSLPRSQFAVVELIYWLQIHAVKDLNGGEEVGCFICPLGRVCADK